MAGKGEFPKDFGENKKKHPNNSFLVVLRLDLSFFDVSKWFILGSTKKRLAKLQACEEKSKKKHRISQT